MALNRFIYQIFKPIEIALNNRSRGELLKVGQPAPDFEVMTHEGRAVTLSSFAGKNLVIWFFPRADTLGCTIEGCAFRDRHSLFQGKNAIVLGVSFDDVDKNRQFAEKFDFPFLLLCDTDRKMGRAYGACQKDADGKAAANRIGYLVGGDGLVKAVYPHADAAAFPQHVLDDIA